MFNRLKDDSIVNSPLFHIVEEDQTFSPVFTIISIDDNIDPIGILSESDIEDFDKILNRPGCHSINVEIFKDDEIYEKSLNLNLSELFENNDGSFFDDEDEPVAFYEPTGLDHIINANAMFESFEKCNTGVSWKEANKRYKARSLDRNRKTAKKIMNDEYKQSRPVEFKLSERGHIRHIKSHRIDDRVVQRSLNDNCLLPKVLPHLISDNAASQKGKGLEYQREHFEKHLMYAYNRWKGDAYILFIDFSKYFDNLTHETLMNEFNKYLTIEEAKFVKARLAEFDVDVSYMTDEEYQNCMNIVFNSLEYSKIPKELRSSGKKMMKKSVGIGSQTSQIAGLLGPNKVDHYVKTVKGIKCYGRYMDDTYIILHSKEDLKNLFYNELVPMYQELNIPVNFKKTQIHKITDNLTYLKINYKIDQYGRLFKKVHQSAFHREHRRLTKFKHRYENGKMNAIDITNCYKSWRGSYYKYDSKDKIKSLDDYFLSTFNLDSSVLKPVSDEQRKENKKKRKENSYLNRYRNYLGLGMYKNKMYTKPKSILHMVMNPKEPII